jgi:hypothetical protein
LEKKTHAASTASPIVIGKGTIFEEVEVSIVVVVEDPPELVLLELVVQYPFSTTWLGGQLATHEVPET